MPRYAKKQVIDAGKLIASKSEVVTDELVAAFKLAHDWRGAHEKPMRRVRGELVRAARKVEDRAIVAARLKRMQSIRRKMQRRPMTLFQMQDIAGARAIMNSMSEVNRLLKFYRGGQSQFTVQREWDYIATPKNGGYRSHHLRLVCGADSEDEAYSHLSVEVQIRSRFQHAWATAVEAVGLWESQDLKSGQGDPRWLRFFELMAGEIAHYEGCPAVPAIPQDRAERLAELKEIDQELHAVRTLDSYNRAIKETENIKSGTGYLYMIQYDNEKREVRVESFSRFSPMYSRFFTEEQNLGRNTVMVEVDRVEDLRRAYPNYFLDVREFTGKIRQLVYGGPAPQSSSAISEEKSSKWAKLAAWMANYKP